MLLWYLILASAILAADELPLDQPDGQVQPASEVPSQENMSPQEAIQVPPVQEPTQPQGTDAIPSNQDDSQAQEPGQPPLVQDDAQLQANEQDQADGAIGRRQCAPEAPSLCYTINDTGDGYAITMEHPKKGMYGALGFGNGMNDADIFVGCVDDEGRASVGHRKSRSHVAPKLISTDPENNPIIASSALVADGFVIEYFVQKAVIKNHDTKLMWSFGNYDEACNIEAQIRYHEDRGFLDLPLTSVS
ncbi:hypothetical protein DSO57_1027753 [Entomophthora muscae]|uniref:Uncharacterized protein n=1 Tax=Entomophthora muscae TaxID=34485 RepID=A0ACC2UMY5_9FUNG|nr:hypothetical protein DSO57_1027753 [Entomophthora muscae]